MVRRRFVFETIGEADAFEQGIEYVNDSSVRVVRQGPEPGGGVYVIVEDDCLDEDE